MLKKRMITHGCRRRMMHEGQMADIDLVLRDYVKQCNRLNIDVNVNDAMMVVSDELGIGLDELDSFTNHIHDMLDELCDAEC